MSMNDDDLWRLRMFCRLPGRIRKREKDAFKEKISNKHYQRVIDALAEGPPYADQDLDVGTLRLVKQLEEFAAVENNRRKQLNHKWVQFKKALQS